MPSPVSIGPPGSRGPAPRRRCLFLDRDGVINVNPPRGAYVRCWEEFRFRPEVFAWIRLFKAAGFLVVVITNQRGVALGLMTERDLAAVHRRMRAELEAQGAAVDDIFCCPHQENTCRCRKPRPGLVLAAQRKWDIDLAASLLVGDSECDRALAAACGIPFVRVRDGQVIETAPAPGAPARESQEKHEPAAG